MTLALLPIGASSLHAKTKPNIKKMTSKESAKNVQAQMTQTQIPGGLRTHSVGVGIGQSFLKGELEENGGDKITADIYYNYSASYSFDMYANIHQSSHKYRGREVTLMGVALGIKSKLFQYDAFSPFLMGGAGFYRPKVKRPLGDIGVVESEGKYTFGVNMGAGVELKLNNQVSMGFLGHYHDPFDVDQEFGPEVEGRYFKLLIFGLYSFKL